MKGLTFMEFIVAVSILAILIGFASPGLIATLDKIRTQNQIKSFESTLHKSRYLAVENRNSITICPLTGTTCSDDWNQPISVFTDLDGDNELDEDEPFHFTQVHTSDAGYWKKRNNITNSLTFTPEGHAWNSATTFLYCPNSNRYHLAKQVIISFQGRIRQEKYLSNRGTPYRSLGGLNCP